MYSSSFSGGAMPSLSTIVASIALLLVIILWFMWFLVKPPKATMTSWMGTSKEGRASDYIADGSTYRSLSGPDIAPPGLIKTYSDLIRPPPTTSFVPASDGVGSCAVSGAGNCPRDLYYKCEQKNWSPDAIGEGLALAAVGSYYVPSDVEDANLFKVVSMAHDPVTAGCANAANLPPYNPNNPNLI